MATTSRQQITGWVAVAVQIVALLGIVLSPGNPDALPPWVRWAGVALMVGGAVIMLVAFLNLGSALTPTPVPVEGAGLRTSGLYARIRHPIYTGLLTLAFGSVVRAPGPWPVFWLVVLAATLTAKAFWEERMLGERYPTYAGYMATTGRFLPRLRGSLSSGSGARWVQSPTRATIRSATLPQLHSDTTASRAAAATCRRWSGSSPTTRFSRSSRAATSPDGKDTRSAAQGG